ncbi:MAG TPA: hypothetical protein VGH25_14485, partial [Dongiaceae bacterium]
MTRSRSKKQRGRAPRREAKPVAAPSRAALSGRAAALLALVLLALSLARAAGSLSGSLLPEPGPGLWLVILLAGLAVVVQLPAERWSGRRALGLASPLLLVLALLAAAAAEVWGVPNASE